MWSGTNLFSIHPHTLLFLTPPAKYYEKGIFTPHEEIKLEFLTKVLKELEM